MAVPETGRYNTPWPRYIGVSQELQRHYICRFHLRIAQNTRHLLLMRGTQHKRRIVEGLRRANKRASAFRRDFQDLFVLEFGDGNMFAGQQVVLGIVLLRERVLIKEGFVSHCALTYRSVWLLFGQVLHCPTKSE